MHGKDNPHRRWAEHHGDTNADTSCRSSSMMKRPVDALSSDELALCPLQYGAAAVEVHSDGARKPLSCS